jgi:ribosome-binding factor A
MPREFPRSRRLEEAVQRVFGEVLSGKVRDPRLHGVIVTDVRVSRDLSVATIYYAKLSGTPAAPDIGEAFHSAAGFLRSTLARELRVRRVPELRFRPDDTLERGRSVEALIERAVGDADVPGRRNRAGPEVPE